jgi:uncharacterized protein YegP (UPF0339 family)
MQYATGRATNNSKPISNGQVIVWGDTYSSYSVASTDKDGYYNAGFKHGNDQTFKISVFHEEILHNHKKYFTDSSFSSMSTLDTESINSYEDEEEAS